MAPRSVAFRKFNGEWQAYACRRRGFIRTARGGHRLTVAQLTTDQFLALLRVATENDVEAALENACVSLPIMTEVEALELFNRMLDVITGDADAALAMVWARIASAMEVNRGGSD